METDSSFFTDRALGVFLSENSTSFAIWSPYAISVGLDLFKNASDSESYASYDLTKCPDGVWEISIPENLSGTYYTYIYNHDGEVLTGVDPYAKAVGINGCKGYICDLSALDPDGWDNTDYVKLNKYTDAVLYEAHVRDFTSDQASGVSGELRGKYKGFTQSGTKTPENRPTCLDHIKDLGITHVHLLPVFDYGRLDESTPKASYNWGYDPENYNAPEGSYSSEPADPEARIRELKELVMALHQNGIGVVMDVVYNHTYKLEGSNLWKAFPGYYYRFDGGKPSNGSGCGNEIASDHAMVRKYIIDSVLFWAKEYKIDGFRFDLMAVLDVEALNELAEKLKEINPSCILYGEGWTGGGIALDHSLSASKNNSYKTPCYAYFNDNLRDSIKGNTFSDAELGYISGNYHLKSCVISGLLGMENWASSPTQIINYCEAHDNLTLWDKIMVSAPGCHLRDRKKMARLATAIILLSQGIPFIHAGQEFLRSKALGDGKFDHNSYRSPDSVNSMKWSMADINCQEVEYFKGLIDFRKNHELLRMTSREDINRHHEILPSAEGTIALRLFNDHEELLIYINPIPKAKVFPLPYGEWEVLVSDTTVSREPMAIYCEGVFVPPISVMVLKKFNW